MTHEVVSLPPEMSIADAWQKMLDTLLKALPVVEKDGAVVGSDRRGPVRARGPAAASLHRWTVGRRFPERRNRTITHIPPDRDGCDVQTCDHRTGEGLPWVWPRPVWPKPASNACQWWTKTTGWSVLSRVDILRLVAEKEAKKMTAPLGGGDHRAGCDVPHHSRRPAGRRSGGHREYLVGKRLSPCHCGGREGERSGLDQRFRMSWSASSHLSGTVCWLPSAAEGRRLLSK